MCLCVLWVTVNLDGVFVCVRAVFVFVCWKCLCVLFVRHGWLFCVFECVCACVFPKCVCLRVIDCVLLYGMGFSVFLCLWMVVCVFG